MCFWHRWWCPLPSCLPWCFIYGLAIGFLWGMLKFQSRMLQVEMWWIVATNLMKTSDHIKPALKGLCMFLFLQPFLNCEKVEMVWASGCFFTRCYWFSKGAQNIHRIFTEMLHVTLRHRCEDSFDACISDHIGSDPPHGVLAVASMFLAIGGAHFYHSPSSFLLGLSRRSDLLLLGLHFWHPFCNYIVKIIPNFECLPYLSSKIKVVREAPAFCWSMIVCCRWNTWWKVSLQWAGQI